MNLSNVKTEDLKAELKRRERRAKQAQVVPATNTQAFDRIQRWGFRPKRLWKVTTEGDVEGRTTQQLGVFRGHLVDIAFMLDDHSGYSLRFSPFTQESGSEIQEVDTQPLHDSVNISLDIGSGTWDLKDDQREKAMSSVIDQFLRIDDPAHIPVFIVEPCRYYAAVTIKRKS